MEKKRRLTLTGSRINQLEQLRTALKLCAPELAAAGLVSDQMVVHVAFVALAQMLDAGGMPVSEFQIEPIRIGRPPKPKVKA